MPVLDDKQLVRLCLNELCAKMGYAERSKISQSDLEHLCYLIEEKTKVVISLSTLKRVFVEKFERLPQVATLDALTQFLGYAGWQDFKARKVNAVSGQTAVPVENAVAERRAAGIMSYRNFALIFGAIILIIIFFIDRNKKGEKSGSCFRGAKNCLAGRALQRDF